MRSVERTGTKRKRNLERKYLLSDHMVPPELIALLSGDEVLDLGRLPRLPVAEKEEGAAAGTAGRVGFKREHEFFEDGDVHRHLYLQDILTGIGEVEARLRVSEFSCQVAGCVQLFDTLESYEHHYNTQHRNVCSSCKRSFPSLRLLDIHILEWHDSLFQVMAEKTNMFQCLVEGCLEKFQTSNERKNHLIKSHLYPSDFRFDKPKKKQSKIKEDGSKDQAMDITAGEPSAGESMEISGSPAGAQSSAQAMSRHKPRVPATICFGHGSVRGFRQTKKKK